MQISDGQMSIILTLLQFVALAVPAVAMMMQVVLRFQDRYGDNQDSSLGWEFHLIEASFLALVLGGVLIAYPIIQSLNSEIAQFGIGLALLALLFLVVATGMALRRPKYPSKSYGSLEEAVFDTGKKVVGTVVAFSVAGLFLLMFIRVGQFALVAFSLSTSTDDYFIELLPNFLNVMSVIMVLTVLIQVIAGVARLLNIE